MGKTSQRELKWSMGNSCGACENLSAGIYLCPGCRDLLIADLEIIPTTVEALWATAARMDVGAGSVGKSGHASPTEPTNSRAYDAGRTLNVILTGWADTLGYREPHAVRAAALLLARINEVRAADWAQDFKRELREILYECDRIMDRMAERITLGRCQGAMDGGVRCFGEIVGIQGQPAAWCRDCGDEVNVHEYKRWMISEAWHVMAPLPAILRALKSSGHLPVPAKRAEYWIKSGKLKPVAENLYTPAAVMDAYRKTPSGRRAA